MTEFKWKKEMIAWAEGKRVQARYLDRQGKNVIRTWETIGQLYCWNLNADVDIEYRILEVEDGCYYRVSFKDSRLPPAVAYCDDGYFRWFSIKGDCRYPVDCVSLNKVCPVEDKVM